MKTITKELTLLAEFFYNCEFYRKDEEIFAFDTNEFGSYCREVDTSD